MRFATASAHGAEQQRKADVISALAPGVGHVARWGSMGLAVDALVASRDAHREHPVRAHEPSGSRPIAPALTSSGGSVAMRVVSARRTLVGLASASRAASLPTSTLARTDSQSPVWCPHPGASHGRVLATGPGRLQRREALDTSEVRLQAGSRSRGLGRTRRGGKRRWREDSRSVRYDGRLSG
jgi:hypothetical protein